MSSDVYIHWHKWDHYHNEISNPNEFLRIARCKNWSIRELSCIICGVKFMDSPWSTYGHSVWEFFVSDCNLEISSYSLPSSELRHTAYVIIGISIFKIMFCFGFSEYLTVNRAYILTYATFRSHKNDILFYVGTPWPCNVLISY